MKHTSWANYGDVDYLDEGGVQVKATNREGIYDVILVIPNDEDENKMYAGLATIDVDDYKTDDYLVKNAAMDFGEDYTDEQFAATIAETEGLVELEAIAFNDYGMYAGYAMSYEAYEIDKTDLAKALANLGVNLNIKDQSIQKENKAIERD